MIGLAEMDELNGIGDDITTQCKHCKYFIEENFPYDVEPNDICAFLHMDNGEGEYDHDAEPGLVKEGGIWFLENPELFPYSYESDAVYQARRLREFGGKI